MPPLPSRFLVSALRELGAARGVEVRDVCGEWILELSAPSRRAHVVGYHFPLNPAPAALLAGDKAGAAAVFEGRGVPCVPHALALRPDVPSPLVADGVFGPLRAAAEAAGWDAVLKPNEGTGGEGLARVRSPRELEAAALAGFAAHRSLALSPFLAIDAEVRAVVLDGEVLLRYEKRRPEVVGDGERTAAELAARAGLAGPSEGGAEVVPAGERRVLDWRHNLGRGAAPVPVADPDLAARADALALRAADALGLRFASIDVVAVGGELRVMEANAGVMMEAYARRSPEHRAAALAVYARALDLILG